ncbi:MAG: endonuclease III, partial [Treponema sp.]|nr:endonuclease III [Treponema sp.]
MAGKKNALLDEGALREVFERFRKQNPEPKSELIAPNAYCFLVSVVLSAQTTDKAVNKATEPLYRKVKTPSQMISLGRENLISYIKSIGLYRNKADHVMALSQRLIDDFDSKVPDNREDLESLPGVGRKTANVVLNVIFGQPTMPVDTHLLRICPRIGIAEGKTPLEVEQSLLKRVPPEYMQHAHHYLLLHGRYTCTARNPNCE